MAEVGGTNSHQSTTNSDRSSESGGDNAGARDEQMSLPTTYVKHMQCIVESYDCWNDAVCLYHTYNGLYNMPIACNY